MPGRKMTRADPPTVPYRAADYQGAGLAFVLETGVWAAVAQQRMPLWLGLVLHLGVLAVLGWRVLAIARRGEDAGAALLLVFAVAVAGPFAAFGALLIGWLSRRRLDDTRRLQDWYDRISLSITRDDVVQAADKVAIGRSLPTRAPAPPPFTALMTSDRISARQAVLGLMARRFHPDYLPALSLALLSPEPVIRVQAAAVATKIRGELADHTERLLDEAADAAIPTARAVRVAGEIERCIASGLLEDRDQERARSLLSGFMARTQVRIDRERPWRVAGGGPRGVIDVYETQLLAEKRFAEVRRLRREQLWARRGPWHYRPLHGRAPARGAL